jgi:2-keto-4-pentenoate hydratase/2-oxohepta-3-ene-1,7-dioic acid hydratase in catechol pathway
MKLVHFDDYRLGVVAGDRVTDVSVVVEGAVPDASPGGGENLIKRAQARLETLIAHWKELEPALKAQASDGSGVPLARVTIRPSVPRPGQLVCAAVNYLETGRPEPAPFNAFLKATTSIIAPGGTVKLPDTPASVFHFEPELALVISRPAAFVKREEAMSYVFGYTPFMDVSARGLPGGFFLGKSWHTFAPMGPFLVTADEVPDPNKLQIKLTVNGEMRHDFSSDQMARHVPELLEEITKVIALEPGDVLATGTHHEGLAPIKDGDTVRLTIERVGPPLEVTVSDPLKRSW